MSSTPRNEREALEKLNQIQPLVDERPGRPPPDTPPPVRHGIATAMLNFFLQPQAVYGGAGAHVQVQVADPDDEDDARPPVLYDPEGRQGQELLRWMWKVGCRHQPFYILYSGTTVSGSLHVIVTTTERLWNCLCAILTTRRLVGGQLKTTYDLNQTWKIEEHPANLKGDTP
jgi:hypothetical protein